MSEIVDASRGIDVVDSSNGGSDEPVPPPRKLCGVDAMERAKERLVALVEHDRLSTSDGGGPSLSCGGLDCRKAPRMEYDLAVHVAFARVSGQLRLVSFDSVDVLLRDDASVERDLVKNRRALARLALGRCKKR